MEEYSSSDDDEISRGTDYDREMDEFEYSPSPSPSPSPVPDRNTSSDETIACFVEMGFTPEMVSRAIEETGGTNRELILETLFKHSAKSEEASSSKSKVIDQLIAMGFAEDSVIKAVQEYGDENIDELTNFLLSRAEAEKLYETEGENLNLSDDNISSDEEDGPNSEDKIMRALIKMDYTKEDAAKAIERCGEIASLAEIVDFIYAAQMERGEKEEAERLRRTEEDDLNLSDDEENSSNENNLLQALISMKYGREEAVTALKICGENANVEEVVDFICAAQMARQFDDPLITEPDEKEPTSSNKKRRMNNEPPRRAQKLNITMVNNELIRLPNPMIGFGIPNDLRRMMRRPVPLPEEVCGPPYFYYENVAMTPKGVWSKISSHLYGIIPEFVDSIYFSATARKRGYIHNLPIHNRFQIHPLPAYTIGEALPSTKPWWPKWDKRTKLNCLLTCTGSAKLTKRIRDLLEKHEGREPPLHVQKEVIDQCKKWNLVWVGKNKVAPLDPVEMEMLLGFPRNHTRGGGVTETNRYKSLGNAFQVDTVAYHLSVLKSLFPNGIKVLSLFTGIGGGEVALHRLKIPLKVVVSVEISEVNQSIFKSFWEMTDQKGELREFSDVQQLDNHTIERLMDKYGGFDLIIGGSPCNNLAGGNRVSRVGLEGEHSSLFFEYCRILKTVRDKAMQRRR